MDNTLKINLLCFLFFSKISGFHTFECIWLRPSNISLSNIQIMAGFSCNMPRSISCLRVLPSQYSIYRKLISMIICRKYIFFSWYLNKQNPLDPLIRAVILIVYWRGRTRLVIIAIRWMFRFLSREGGLDYSNYSKNDLHHHCLFHDRRRSDRR